MTRFADQGRRGSPEQIVREIERLDSDILFLPEAFDQIKPIEPAVLEHLKSLGYTVVEAAYADSGSREYAATVDPHMLVLGRLGIESIEITRLGGIRNALTVRVTDPETNRHVRFIGIHLDDRSEKNRLSQVEDLLPLIASSSLPTVLMGDFNAMYQDSLPARIVRHRAVLAMINHWPHTRSGHILHRLSEMAIGETMSRILSETNLTDADPKSQPTTTPKMRGQEWMPSIRMVQIDHILSSPEVETSAFAVARDGGSDHRAISAILTLT